MKYFLLTLLLCAACFAQVSPFQGLGNAQWFDNNGKPLTSGVLYSYQAGTTSQQATYSDGTGTIQNPNPITFTSGARVSIWLTSGAFYKFVLCLQNDGPFCAPADVLFSVDQVPGSPASSGGTSSSPFISGSANPATSGILRLASADSICWRNAANSANLCVSKDANDVLAWAGGSIKFPEIACTGTGTGFDFLCADQTAHRFKQCGNGGSCTQFVDSGVDINTSDQVIQLHFGTTGLPLSGTPPSTGQFLRWDGSNIVGGPLPLEATYGIPFASPNNGINDNCGTVGGQCGETVFANAHTLVRFTFQLGVSPIGCAASMIIGVRDMTSSTNLTTATVTNGQTTGFVDSGALSVAIPAGHTIGIGVLQTNTLCSTTPQANYLTMVYQ